MDEIFDDRRQETAFSSTSSLNPSTSTLYTLTPSHHSYLGNDLQSIRERIFFEDESILPIPILFLDSVILFPTESIPLRIQNQHLVSYFRTHSAVSISGGTPILLGVIGRYYSRELHRVTSSKIGTIIEAVATKFENDIAIIMAKGRCRFRIITRYQDPVYHIPMVKAFVLNEGYCTYSPAASVLHNSKYYSQGMNKFPFWVYQMYNLHNLMSRVNNLRFELSNLRKSNVDLNEQDQGPILTRRMLIESDSDSDGDSEGNNAQTASEGYTSSSNEDDEEEEEEEKQETFVDMSFGQHESENQQYDEDSNYESKDQQMEQMVHEFNEQENPEDYDPSTSPSEDASHFAYRIGGELFIHDGDRQLFLECETIYERYKMILFTLQKKINVLRSPSPQQQSSSAIPPIPTTGVLICIQCSQILGRESSIFQVPGAVGTIGAYVNPHGVVHQTLTAQKLIQTSVYLVGEPTAEQSWFPGYCWTIAYCSGCFQHLGWKFTVENQMNPTLCKEFWGLRRSAVSCETRPESVLPSGSNGINLGHRILNLLFPNSNT